ncbi:MAG: hypothetical protein QM796_00175, partial [Chthoniobacteraceae bacterium]
MNQGLLIHRHAVRRGLLINDHAILAAIGRGRHDLIATGLKRGLPKENVIDRNAGHRGLAAVLVFDFRNRAGGSRHFRVSRVSIDGGPRPAHRVGLDSVIRRERAQRKLPVAKVQHFFGGIEEGLEKIVEILRRARESQQALGVRCCSDSIVFPLTLAIR